MSGLRQRKPFDTPKFLQRIKEFDVYPKVEEDYRVRTLSGGAVSIVSGIIIILLFLSELNSYLTGDRVEHVVVDVSRGQKLRINFNITFPSIHCGEVVLDAMDVSGEQQVDVAQTIAKQRLDETGRPITREQILAEEANVNLPADYCGSCFGADSTEMPCCNTCLELKQAYADRGWDSRGVEMESEQCKRQQTEGKPGEGCTMFGFIEVNKVAGNFHVALGASHRSSPGHQAKHTHQFRLADTDNFNVSHVINKLSFGEEIPGVRNPLDGVAKILDHGTGVYQYFVKIVPTEYTFSRGRKIVSNQFSATEQFRQIDFRTGMFDMAHALPGVFFLYDFSPFMVQVTEKHEPFAHFLTNVCAILGGIFTIAGIVDSLLYHSSRMMKEK
eukprot:GILI01028528.1.p1 GENE.GILI01028528.1~~GILI01028528.1.p1  ORF type:complete len:386 (-),score=78.63 GILI01028528.1:38-1195(-)